MAVNHIWENEFAKRYYSTQGSVNFFDYSKTYEKPPFAFTVNGIPFLPFGSVNAIMGQPGNGKSMMASIIAIAALKGVYCGFQWNDASRCPNVLYFDTEQMEYESALHAKRIVGAAGRNTNQRYIDFNYLRATEGQGADECRHQLMDAVIKAEPNIIIIDGAPDCVRSINEELECKDFVDLVREIAVTYNAVAICVAHQNHGTDKMLGFLGSILERKVTNALEVIKHKKDDKKITETPSFFEVKTIKVRGQDIGNFTFKMEYDGECVIPLISADSSEAIKETAENEDVKAIAAEIFKGREDTPFESQKSILTAIRTTYNIGTDRAKTILDKMVDDGIVLARPIDAKTKRIIYEYNPLPF